MDELLTEQQEAERARRWIRENGAFLLLGIVLGLGGLFGWQYWKDYSRARSGEASIVWEQMRSAIDGQRGNEAGQSLAVLEADYAGTPYLDQARLAMAKWYMDRSDPDAAAAQLRKLAEKPHDPYLGRLGELRLAQVLIYQEQYEDALALLGESDDTALAGLFHELRGDAYFRLGELEKARDQYDQALQADVPGVLDRSFLQMKLDDVAGSLQSSAAPDDAAQAEAAPDAASPGDAAVE